MSGNELQTILSVKCPNDVCVETFQIPEPKPQALNSTYFSAVTFPTRILRCKACGTVIQLLIKSFECQIDWGSITIGKVDDGPRIHIPS